MFCEIIPHFLTSWFPVNVKVFLFYPVLHPIKLNVHCLGPFLSNRSGDDALGRRVVCFYWGGGWVKSSSWSVIIRGTTVYPLWNSPPTSASSADATTCLRILYSVWIRPFSGGGRFRDFFGLGGSELR